MPKVSAVMPFILFIIIFIGSGLHYQYQGIAFGFYELSATIAILPPIILAIIWSQRKPNKNISSFIQGCGQENIITMCLIYLLAGAFSSVAQSIGSVNAVVHLGVTLIPPEFMVPGIFLVSALMATAIGTSMGTISAIAPIALGITQTMSISSEWIAGAVLGGALFGDNLSMISDTTIAVTRTQGCGMKDKFKKNFIIVLPAAMITVFMLVIQTSNPIKTNTPIAYDHLLLSLPYFFIFVLALLGINVFTTLLIGIFICLITGLCIQGNDFILLSKEMYKGFESMTEIMILSIFIGGLSEVMKKNGGIDYLLNIVNKIINKCKNANKVPQLGICGLATLSTLCTANNVASILIVGDLSKEIANKNNISPRTSASFIDIFSCVTQGLIPYGAQALLLGTVFSLSPLSIVTHNLYCICLLCYTLVYILFFNKNN